MATVKINDDNFESVVLASDKTVLIDLYADWCGPCKMLAPIVESISEEHPEYLVCKVNVDNSPKLTRKFRVMSIPMLVVMKDGDVIESAVGYRTKENILEMLAE